MDRRGDREHGGRGGDGVKLGASWSLEETTESFFFFFRKNNPSKMRDDGKERQGPSIFFTHYPVTEGPLLVLP